jgi:hypothetical protein
MDKENLPLKGQDCLIDTEGVSTPSNKEVKDPGLKAGVSPI